MWNGLYQLRLHNIFLYICIFKQKLAQELVTCFVEYIPVKTVKSPNKRKTPKKQFHVGERNKRNIEKHVQKVGYIGSSRWELLYDFF